MFNNHKEPAASVQSEEVNLEKINEELGTLTVKVMESLTANYEGIGDILSEYQKSLTIQTSLESGDSKSKQIAMDIQKSVEDILDSEELEYISTDSYKIFVESEDGEIIN